MPLLNFGVTPGGAAGTELQAVTRRAVMPAVVVQLGKSTVTLSSMLAAAEPVKGGVSPVTFPVQGTRMVTAQFVDYSGASQGPTVQTGMFNAEYNLAALTAWIPYYLFEGLIQQDAELVPLIWARMNDAGNVFSDLLASKLWAAFGANAAIEIFSLLDIIDTANPTQGNVGNLDRGANTWWQANKATITSLGTGSTALTRTNMLASATWAQKQAGGEPPSCALVSPGAFMTLAADVIGAERYTATPEGAYGDLGEGPTVGFPALRIGTIPVFADLYQTVNTVVLWPNWNYLAFKIHQDAAFVTIGPESLLPSFQLGYLMVLLALLQVVCSKPAAQGQMTGWTGSYSI